jgi:hypothetical protein
LVEQRWKLAKLPGLHLNADAGEGKKLKMCPLPPRNMIEQDLYYQIKIGWESGRSFRPDLTPMTNRKKEWCDVKEESF